MYEDKSGMRWLIKTEVRGGDYTRGKESVSFELRNKVELCMN